MVTEETIKRTREFAELSQQTSIDRSSDLLDDLKNSIENGNDKFSILAFKSVVARENNIILRRKQVNPNVDVLRQQATIKKYTEVISNLNKIKGLQITDGPSLEKASRSLQSILQKDITLRGVREKSVQADLRDAMTNVKDYAITYSILDRVIENDDSSKRAVELNLLKRLRPLFKKYDLDSKELETLILLWQQPEFQTIIWMLKYGNVSHPSKNNESNYARKDPNFPPGTYVLLSTDLSNTSPEKLYTTNLNPDYAENNKENIYYWFRRKYPDMLNTKIKNGIPESKAWEEVRGLLELSGFGYISKTEKIKTRQGEEPKYVYDEDAFWGYYNEWKEKWKKKLHMNEVQWVAYILKLDPYL